MIGSDIYGVMDKVFDNIDAENAEFIGSRKSKPLRSRVEKPLRRRAAPDVGRVMPEVSIDADQYETDDVSATSPQNVVSISEEAVQGIVAKTDRRAKSFSKMLLYGVAPEVMGYSAASNYVRAALKTLGIDSEVDTSLADGIRAVSRLTAMYNSIRGCELPKSIKRRYMERLSDRLADATADRFDLHDKSTTRSRQLHELEAVVRKSSQKKAQQESSLPLEAPPSTLGMSRRGRR